MSLVKFNHIFSYQPCILKILQYLDTSDKIRFFRYYTPINISPLLLQIKYYVLLKKKFMGFKIYKWYKLIQRTNYLTNWILGENKSMINNVLRGLPSKIPWRRTLNLVYIKDNRVILEIMIVIVPVRFCNEIRIKTAYRTDTTIKTNNFYTQKLTYNNVWKLIYRYIQSGYITPEKYSRTSLFNINRTHPLSNYMNLYF